MVDFLHLFFTSNRLFILLPAYFLLKITYHMLSFLAFYCLGNFNEISPALLSRPSVAQVMS